MGLLFPHLRIHQVFGANTDVGKTIITTALIRATAKRASDSLRSTVHYVKPVSTGHPQDADDVHVSRFTDGLRPRVQISCLFKFNEPVSPHLAATQAASKQVPSDEILVDGISKVARSASSYCSKELSSMFVETAGGVHSPTPSGTSQADAYRLLRLPIILIGDSKLGGISATISAYESLLLRGYDVDSVLLFKDDYYKNWEYLSGWFQKKKDSTIGSRIQVHAISQPPPKLSDPDKDAVSLEGYYEDIASEGELPSIIEHLNRAHLNRLEDLQSMPHRSLESVWWPFVQHGLLGDGRDITVIDSAHNDTFETFSHHLGKKLNTSHLVPLFDGSASWWTQSLGHANPDLTLAAAYAAGRYGHVIFPQAIHGPALELTERLLRGPGKGWASRVFFSDNGSTGMEVALKMAVRATSLRYGNPGSKELGVIGLKGSYHGDTIGAMDACESGVFNAAVEWHRERGFWFDVPTVGVRGGRVVVSTEALGLRETAKAEEFDSISQVYDIRRRLQQPLAQEYRRYIQSTLEQQVAQGHAFGALVIEPLLMGAGGMIFVDPLFHRVLVDVVRMSEDLFLKALDGGKREKKSPIDVASAWRGLPVVFDEVFVGLYRLGLQTSAPLLGVNPDILVLAKILTGGLLPLSATLASQSIFDAFYGKQKMDALLHGHSYTAYPVGCAVANESVNSLERISHSGSWNTAKKQWDAIPSEKDMDGQRVWSFWNPQFLLDISMLDSVEATMALGTVLAIHLRDQSAGYQSITGQNLLSPLLNTFGDESSAFGVHYRTLGNVIYLMSSLNTPQAIFSLLENRLSEILQRCSKG